MLNLGQLLGSGIFSVPGVVLDSVGSVGLFLSFWAIAPVFALGSWRILLALFGLICLSSQSLCSPTRNLLASFPDDPAQKLYFSSRLIHAQDSLCLPLSPLLRFSFRACSSCDYCWVAITLFGTRFSATNSVVFAQYTLSFFDLPITDFSQTVLAVGVATFSVAGSDSRQSPTCFSHLILVVAISTKWSLRAVNALSLFKVLSLVLLVHLFPSQDEAL